MLAGEVEVDGEVVTRLGTKVDPATAVIRVSGERLPPIRRTRTSCSTSRAVWCPRCRTPRAAVPSATCIADRPERLFHVGRLDTDTSGLLLLTNDGDFAHRMAHPSYEVEKTYVAEVEGGPHPSPVSGGCGKEWRFDDGPVDGGADTVITCGGGRGRGGQWWSWRCTRGGTGSCDGCSTSSAIRYGG